MLTIHHLGHSQSERIVWLCEELGVPYELTLYERDAVTILSPPALRALRPLGADPVIQDDALLLAESAPSPNISYSNTELAACGFGRIIRTSRAASHGFTLPTAISSRSCGA
jgi:glutathione S-transferase